MAPRPKPTAIKELSGNPGKRAQPPNEPKPAIKLPAPTRWLSDDGRAEYRRVGRLLVKIRVMTEADQVALAAYAQNYVMWVNAMREIATDGLVQTQPSGRVIVSPMFEVMKHAERDMRRYLLEFGMTPASRTRVQAQTEDEGDEFDRFLRGAG